MQKKIKSLLPSLKEKKRYLAYRIITKEKKINERYTAQEIAESINKNLGAFESSEAGIIPIESNQDRMTGIIRISNKQMNRAKAALTLIKEIGNQKAIVQSLTSSGMLNKARNTIKN